jgi:glycosyltransferase involved in cell wall biosynthesis
LSSQTLINGLIGLLKRIGFYKKTKVIVRESNSIFHLLKGIKLKMYALAYNVGYSSVNLVICQTDYMKHELLKSVPWMKENINMIVLNNPINSDLIQRKSQLKLKEIGKMDFIVAAGRLVPAKGFDVLLNSFQSIHIDFPNLKLLILGEGKDKDKLNALIDSNGLNNFVQLVGFVENVYPYFKKAKLCVMSSRIEGFPNVLLQMMSQNTKVVSTLSAGGIEKLDGVFTCNTNDSEALAFAVKECLNSNTEGNRNTFDLELGKRSLKNFVNEITKQSSSQNN